MPSRAAYEGGRRKIILGFDVGTTYSGISYRQVDNLNHYVGLRMTLILKSHSILDPSQMPGIKGVTKCDISTFNVTVSSNLCRLTRFPAQETISGASKIPTIIYYDKNGQVKAVGAEATKDGIYETAMDQGWIKAEWCAILLPQSTI